MIAYAAAPVRPSGPPAHLAGTAAPAAATNSAGARAPEPPVDEVPPPCRDCDGARVWRLSPCGCVYLPVCPVCSEPSAVVRRLLRQRRVETSPACRALAEMVETANRLLDQSFAFCAEHGPGCDCPLCEFIKEGPYGDRLFDYFTVFKITLESSLSAITCHLPPSCCEAEFAVSDAAFEAKLAKYRAADAT